MKIQYKAASIMTVLGVVIVALLSLCYNAYNHKIILDKEMGNLENIATEIASHVESHLKSKALIAITLSSAPLIKKALLKSNSEFAALPENEQKHEIDKRNRQWIKTVDINDPFIQAHMTNPAAEYLKHQQIIVPGEYGEIFLTNRYGVMIATTSKLTTLTHAHKYWWLACYDDGRGRVFLDDRGFDKSVQGYVLGVVIPIIDKNEILGILKCNVNIMGPLTDVIREFSLNNSSRIKIVRTGGLIVFERDVTPLSTQVNETLVELLWQKKNNSMIISEANGNQLVAFSPIGITMGSEQFGFGGKQGSVDHIKGNKGEAWHVVISLSEEKAIKTADEITVVIVIVGIIFTFLTATVSLFLGKWIARPIVELAITAQTIGEGNLEARTGVHSNDEIGRLATTFNNMASKRKQAESALRESENRVRDISLSMADWIWEVDKNGKYTFVSDTVKNVLGYSSDELIGKEPFELMSSEEGDRIKAIFLETVSRSGPIHDLENWNLAKDGTEVCFLTNGVQIFNADRELQGYRGVNKDITHQKKIEAEKASIEDQLRQAQKMESVGRLAGGVAHDYNNALTVILGFTELAMGTMDSNESIYDDLNQVLKAARQAADITRQLLAFARKQTIAPEVLDLNENVKTVLKMLQRLIGEDISLAWLPGANLWSVKIDPSQIDQIMANLCVNARDAISGVGKITIETGTVVLDTAYCVDHYGFIPGAFVILSVSDDGCGIDSEILNNIFEPFFTTKPADKGTGLGLATVYGIVKQNNGFISVYSEPGEGTTIRIYLPRHEGNAVPIQRESTEEIPSGHGETILIVEDDLMILKVTKKILDELGYSVLTASTPEEAMGVLKKFPEEIYLLLTDVVMPGMNGRKLSERLQSICPDLKCVFMSGYTANAIAQHGVLDQGLFFIQKPFSKLNLAKIVRKALDA